jgi:hypothetical protein
MRLLLFAWFFFAIPLVSKATPVPQSFCQIGDAGCRSSDPEPEVHAGPVVATNFSGVDIGAKVNNAIASCAGHCRVEIPAGNYTYSTTIVLPVHLGGGITLACDTQSTTLNYTGSGDAIRAFGAGDTEAGIVIEDCGLSGAKAGDGANGLHLRAFGQAVFQNLRILNFPGAGVLNEGANSVTFLNPDFEANCINIHNVGIALDGVGYSPNAIKVFGGIIGYAKQWGVFEDSAQAAIAFPNGGNVYEGVVFEANGTNGETSGNAFFQACDGCVISNSYLEFFPKDHIPYNVVIGDSSTNGIGGLDCAPQGVKIVNNHLLSDNATTAIFIINARMPVVDGNSEVGNVTNFLSEGGAVEFAYIGRNIALAATNFLTGPGITIVADDLDASQPTSTGLGFNSLTGYQQDLQIRTRQGGAENLIGINAAGNQIYSIDNSGVASFDGVKVQGAGLTFGNSEASLKTFGGNSLIAGTIVVSGAKAGTVNFATSYKNPPSCQITPQTEIGAARPSVSAAKSNAGNALLVASRRDSPRWWVSTTPSSVTANLSEPGDASFSYFCVGNPD